MRAAPTTATGLPGVVIIEPQVFTDDRGFFLETYHKEKYAERYGITCDFVQDNRSGSRKGALRGLHYQPRYAQDKLCQVVRGEVLDVVVDIRAGSSTFGKWMSVVLSESNRRQVFVPKGFAHGFLCLSDFAEFAYKCSDFYHPEDEYGIIWNDPQIGIDWGEKEMPQLSRKDAGLPRLADVSPDRLPPL